MSCPTVAVVGRPNVGKSSLFNIIAGARISIVDPTPGATRDRVLQKVSWGRHTFWLVDTSGLDGNDSDLLHQHMTLQTEMAIDTADVVVFLVDAKDGLHPLDEIIAARLRNANKPVIVAVNKCDQVGATPPEVYEFYALGFDTVVPLSAAHRLGIAELMDATLASMPEATDDELDPALKIAVIGKPNAGKSSLVNALLGRYRTIVSDVAGTTRDAIDETLDVDGERVIFIDTAGLRRSGKIERGIEKYAMLRALTAIERSDVCLICIDGAVGVTAQDAKVAGLAHDAGKASIVVVTKWDSVDKEHRSIEGVRRAVAERFPFLRYAPVVTTSAKTGLRVDTLIGLARAGKASAMTRLSTSVLNEWLSDAVVTHPAPHDKGRTLKLYYMTQVAVAPPTFVFFVNDKTLSHFSYERYLQNRLRESFGFDGTPIRFLFRNRGERDEIVQRDLGQRAPS